MIRSIAAAVRMDWVRVTTVRASAVLIGCLLGLGALVAGLLAVSFRGDAVDAEMSAVLITNGGSLDPLPFLAVFMGIFAALMVGHDYRHGLIRPVLAAVPNRVAVLLGRMIVLAVVAVLAGVITVVVNAGVGIIILGGMPIGSSVLQASAGYVLLGVLWAWLGAGLTWLFRSTAPVLVILFIVPLVVEPVISGLSMVESLKWLDPVVTWLPFAAGRALALTGGGGGDDLTPAEGGLVFLALVLVVSAAAGTRFTTRDA